MPDMTRNHYQIIADIINEMPTFNATLRTQRESTAQAFAKGLKRTNPNFDADRFLTAALKEDR